MGREIRRTLAALALLLGDTAGETAPEGGPSVPRRFEPRGVGSADAVSRTRAIVQIALTALLLPLTLYVVFGPRDFAQGARDAASALLGAIVTFWLKD
jgi:hypothetical protein